ncbi:MAG: SIMPL domain-containing protein [Acidobacteriia bacterium]|nr:SIMPL domain-containing protein [Terriglobia bacterium]
MRKFWPILLLLSALEPVFGQLETDTVTITASRQVALVPDQAVFFVTVTTGEDAGLDQALALVQGTGITAANLNSVYSYERGLQWSFTLAVPFSKIASTIAALTGGQKGTSRAVDFTIQGTQVSDEARQSQPCKTADLISDAQTQAQKLADSAGFTIGPVLALSDAGTSPVPNAVAAFSFIAFYPVVGILYSTQPPPSPINCAATVKFRLQRFH